MRRGAARRSGVGALIPGLSRLIACGLALVLVGCADGPSKDSYEAEMDQVATALGKDVATIDRPGQRPARRAAQLKSAQAAVERGANRFDRIRPPEDVAGLHRRLVLLVRGFAGDLSELIRVESIGGERRFRLAAAAFERDPTLLRQLADLESQYEQKGYALDLG